MDGPTRRTTSDPRTDDPRTDDPRNGWSTYGPANHRERVRRWARNLGRRPGEWYGLGRPLEREDPLVPRVVVVTAGLGVLVLAALVAGVLLVAPQSPPAVRTAPSSVATGDRAEQAASRSRPEVSDLPSSPDPTTSVTEERPATLELGSTGADVSRLQEALERLGIHRSGVTGEYDQQTWTSVQAFQLRVGGTGDPEGVYGPGTRAALEAALSGT